MNIKTIHFIVLALILSVGLYTLSTVGGDHTMQLSVVIAMAISYVAWGVTYHMLEGNLHRKVVIEYLLIAAIAVVVFATVL
jgi:hypothetical protein